LKFIISWSRILWDKSLLEWLHFAQLNASRVHDEDVDAMIIESLNGKSNCSVVGKKNGKDFANGKLSEPAIPRVHSILKESNSDTSSSQIPHRPPENRRITTVTLNTRNCMYIGFSSGVYILHKGTTLHLSSTYISLNGIQEGGLLFVVGVNMPENPLSKWELRVEFFRYGWDWCRRVTLAFFYFSPILVIFCFCFSLLLSANYGFVIFLFKLSSCSLRIIYFREFSQFLVDSGTHVGLALTSLRFWLRQI